MIKAVRIVPVLLFGVLSLGGTDRNSTRLYKGPWFDVRYPSTFSTVPTGEEDGISFRSRDNEVTFYVYSPQWNGSSTWIERRSGETVVDSTQSEGADELFTTRVTYRSSDGTLRSYEDIENRQLNARRIFGIAYRSEGALKKYRDAYLAFKRSLRQYAD